MKYLCFIITALLLIACHPVKDSSQTSNATDSVPVLKTRQDSLEYFRKKGIDYSLDEKMLPVMKGGTDTIHKW